MSAESPISSVEVRKPTATVQRQLDGATAQWALYARDLLDDALKCFQEARSVRVEVRAIAGKVTLIYSQSWVEVSPPIGIRAFPAVHHRRCNMPLTRDGARPAPRKGDR